MIAEGCDHGDVDREKGRIMSQHDFCVGGVDFAWWVPYFLAHCNYWMIFGAFWSHQEIPIDLRYFISVLSYGP